MPAKSVGIARRAPLGMPWFQWQTGKEESTILR